MQSLRRIIILSLFILLPVVQYAQDVDEIRFYTEYYPPYNYTENGVLTGISVDLVEAILNKLESRQSREDIELVPWARGFNELLKHRNVSLFSITRSEEREEKFQWVGPIASNTISLIARKDSRIRIQNFDQVMRYRVGAVIEDIAQQQLVEKGLPIGRISLISGVTVIHQAMRMLDLRRIDLFAYDEDVFKWELLEKGHNPDDYEVVYILKKSDLYIAFNREADEALVRTFQSALDELKDDGTLESILNKYRSGTP